jgi:hypothetical protein
VAVLLLLVVVMVGIPFDPADAVEFMVLAGDGARLLFNRWTVV